MTKTKYRIVQTYMSDHSIYYRVDQRLFWFIWDKGQHFNTVEEARAAVAKLKYADTTPKDMVIEES